ncbi:hypothetical protein OH492_28585 [Vibrio chagasii]|nr:hypothetical protein [Vibrio chagasii]
MAFWYSHPVWMIRNYNTSIYKDHENCRDLKKDKIVMWQHKHYILLALIMNFGVPIALGLIYGDVIMLLIVGTRVGLVPACTAFFINIFAHLGQPNLYRRELQHAILTRIAAWRRHHSFHHIFENDLP